MAFLSGVFFFVLTLGILVSIHEGGHYVVARLSGVRILRFALGFGPAIYRRMWRDGTEFAICAVPLGGYVRMLDEREGPVAKEDAERSFNRLSPWWRIAIALAGPGANLLLAVFAYWIVLQVGVRDLPAVFAAPPAASVAAAAEFPAGGRIVAIDGTAIDSAGDALRALSDRLGETGRIDVEAIDPLGNRARHAFAVQDWQKGVDVPDIFGGLGLRPAVIAGDIQSASAAERAGVRRGDQIVALDGQPVTSWRAFHEAIRAAPERRLSVGLLRDGEPLEVALVPAGKVDDAGKPYGLAGIAAFTVSATLGVFEALPAAVARTANDVELTLGFLGKIVTGLVSAKNLSGPLTIAQVASDSADAGYEYYVSVLAMLSVSLAVLNLLPIPVLDGGHVIYALAEAVRGKALSERVQVLGLQIGLALVASLMILALYNDVARLFVAN